jgi:hypothetical protein
MKPNELTTLTEEQQAAIDGLDRRTAAVLADGLYSLVRWDNFIKTLFDAAIVPEKEPRNVIHNNLERDDFTFFSSDELAAVRNFVHVFGEELTAPSHFTNPIHHLSEHLYERGQVTENREGQCL